MKSSRVSDAKKILELEAQSILVASERLGAEFDTALSLIKDAATNNRKLIIIGMGKSHYIAAKIAASFMSTGLTAIFLHPAEAIHGDLGIITQGDVCLLISKSGSTPEIVALLPFLKEKTKIISIIGNKKSPMGDASDCILDATVEKEACPINLLPTSSTTVALAIGDALVATFARIDGLNPERFAGFHPGGSLGKRLLKEVSEVMLPIEKTAVGTGNESLKEAAELMSAKPVGALCIVDKENKLKGILVDGDLRRALAKGIATTENISQFLIQKPVTLEPNMLVNDALASLEQKERQITSAPVVDSTGTLVGFARIHDLL
ncbi:MAG: KpsF/GutQ family sugar-phosphate isomerase [Bdellovibrionota bacterium]